MERVGFIHRLGAFLIDLVICTIAVHCLTAVDLVLNITTNLNNFGIVSLVGGGLLLLGYGFAEALTATTPGKRLTGIVIASADGAPASRRALLIRWLVKNIAVFFAIPMSALWVLLSPYNYHVQLPDFVALGVLILAVIDTILTAILLLIVIAGCFMATKPDRQTLHDALSGTAVFRRAEIMLPNAFEPIVTTATPEG
jgi:uncharacterized RDD family membrane protein YckC